MPRVVMRLVPEISLETIHRLVTLAIPPAVATQAVTGAVTLTQVAVVTGAVVAIRVAVVVTGVALENDPLRGSLTISEKGPASICRASFVCL